MMIIGSARSLGRGRATTAWSKGADHAGVVHTAILLVATTRIGRHARTRAATAWMPSCQINSSVGPCAQNLVGKG